MVVELNSNFNIAITQIKNGVDDGWRDVELDK